MHSQQSGPLARGPMAALTPETALKTRLGAASPLWAAYMGAAGAGIAFWWMTGWMRPSNLEALYGRMATLEALDFQAEVEPPVVEASVIEPPAIEPVQATEEGVEAATEPLREAPPSVEAAAKPSPPADGLSPTARALIARRKAATSAKAAKPA